ncbi:MAG TPA: N-acetyl-gamma-glutamyl-phosphate reductase [Gemmatimonadales bacterium]|nr:N-acetyl-gamma-glutamyl-phosphate reductase [Gemmatimonadales bacterium]
MTERCPVAIVGGSGYVGGELLRLLLFHPHAEVSQVTSGSQAGAFAHTAHPNLRGVTDLQFVDPAELKPCTVLFLAQPHGQSAAGMDRYAAVAQRIVDCSADFRLRDPLQYRRWYGAEHPAPGWLPRFVYGLPERTRQELAGARYASGVGCNAAVTILALAPLADAGLLRSAVVDVKVGSSEAGAQPGASSHHPERSGAVRSFKPTGHRHQAEVRQALGDAFDLSFSVTAVELVRGALATAHCFLHRKVDDKDLWRLYRQAYGERPFVRLVKQRSGTFRYPEPKVLAGTNYCDIGFEVDLDSPAHRVVLIAAIDNLMKGAAGSAVQCMNLMMGWEETAGLTFPGLHPI